MEFDAGPAILAGLVATGAMTVLMYMAGAMMGMRMDMPMMLGTMLLPPGGAARAVGLMMHFMMGAIFFAIYALLFDALGIDSGVVWWAGVFGLGHGVMAGAMMGMMGAVHPRMTSASGTAEVMAPGAFGTNYGTMAPVAIVLLHVVFGLVGGAIYAL